MVETQAAMVDTTAVVEVVLVDNLTEVLAEEVHHIMDTHK